MPPVQAAGGITVLVSHRFSTVRMADLIVVLDGSRLVEVGSHDDLLRRGQLCRAVPDPGRRVPLANSAPAILSST